jgi:hypothetical protein
MPHRAAVCALTVIVLVLPATDLARVSSARAALGHTTSLNNRLPSPSGRTPGTGCRVLNRSAEPGGQPPARHCPRCRSWGLPPRP